MSDEEEIITDPYIHFSTHKKMMLQALEKSMGIVTVASNSIGIHRDTHYKWMKNDKDYKKAVEGMDDLSLDISESKLHELIQEGNITAIIFHLKTKGKKRGYTEKPDKEDNSDSIIEGFKAIATALNGGDK